MWSIFNIRRQREGYPKFDVVVAFCARAREECYSHFIISMKFLKETFYNQYTLIPNLSSWDKYDKCKIKCKLFQSTSCNWHVHLREHDLIRVRDTNLSDEDLSGYYALWHIWRRKAAVTLMRRRNAFWGRWWWWSKRWCVGTKVATLADGQN